jgi:hypothetical protein
VSRGNGLSSAEEERLALAIEEMGEAIQIAAKVLRHGWQPVDHAVDPPIEYDNRALFEKEMGQVMHAARLMCAKGDVSGERIQESMDEREKSVKKYLHHQ